MGDTKISWTHRAGTRGRTWNPTQGCWPVSPGCANCYACRTAARFSGEGKWAHGLVKLGKKKGDPPKWTGESNFAAHKLIEPLSWREPSTIFVNSMSDLYWEAFSFEQIAAVYGIVAACPHHTFQVLTKRAERMLEWFLDENTERRVERFRVMALAGRIEEFFAPERDAPIDGFPGYFVTTRGRILSEKRGERRELEPLVNHKDHCRVQLYRNGRSERPFIHRLVLAAFDGPGRDRQACHLDGDPTNNALWNLRWGSQIDNWDDSKRHETHRRYHKLTEAQVAEIREASSRGESAYAISRVVGVSDTQVRNIITGRQWKEMPRAPWPPPNLWVGVSAENQDAWNERVRHLNEIKEAHPEITTFVSCEPLLGPIDIDPMYCDHCDLELEYSADGTGGQGTWSTEDLPDGKHTTQPTCNECGAEVGSAGFHDLVDLVIAGCESGPRSRPCEVEWLRQLRDACAREGITFFLKQAKECGTEVAPDPVDGVVRYVVRAGPESRIKPGGVIELPYLDGVQHKDLPGDVR